jgi:hypothetical protein
MFPVSRKRRLLAVVLVLAVLVVLGGLALAMRRHDTPSWQPDWSFGLDEFAVQEAAPETNGEDIDGQPLRLSDYRGQVVVVSFWVHW